MSFFSFHFYLKAIHFQQLKVIFFLPSVYILEVQLFRDNILSSFGNKTMQKKVTEKGTKILILLK